MGDPKRKVNLWKRPKSIWQKARMTEETALMREFGLRRKSELWRTNGLVSKFSRRAKSLIKSIDDEQAKKEEQLLIKNMQSLGVLSAEAALDDVLAIKPRDFLERRLQTIVYRKGLAKTMRQARQFIVHKHILVGDNVVIAPSFLVTKSDETKILFRDSSALADEDHPERTDKQPVVETKETEETVEEKTEEVKEQVEAESTEEKVEEVKESVEETKEEQPVEEKTKSETKEETPEKEVKEEPKAEPVKEETTEQVEEAKE